ncbi:MAG: 50S ribosomal protein L24 [Gammaproteobacteria bacterium]|nr:50S ribosomal protein L24 [Gammaproteobacteria bacterium]
MAKLRKGDTVIVVAGKDKGKQGQVEKVLKDDKLLVTNINIAKKHVKPNPDRGITGGIVSKTMPIHASNVAILNPQTNKADRIGYKFLEDGKKVRYFKSNDEVIA